jgi:[ribosomal protein S5]-alanine N-acetyltransferase
MNTTFKYALENQESERLLYRKVVESDFETWLAFCNDPDSVKYIFSQQQLLVTDPVERCKMWFDRVFHRYENKLGGMNALIDKQTNELVGMCGLLMQTIDGIAELEIGYSIMPNYRNKGYALEAAKKCRDFAFENNLSPSLVSMIHVDNHFLAKVAIGNGMHLEKTILNNGDSLNIYRITKDEFNLIN